jgi:glycosyltransferase involved in cell wall biosynthesis
MKSAKIKLTHLVLDMELGGLQRLITQMTFAMDHDLFEVDVVCMNREGCFADQLRSRGFTVTLLQKSQQSADLWYPVRLARFLRKRKTDILQMHTGVFIFGALAGTLAFTPATVYTEHGRGVVDHPVRQAEDRIAVKLVDRLVPVSESLDTVLVERIKAPRRKLVTIINGIATDLFSNRPRPQALLEEFSLPADCRIIGTVARLDAVKDQIGMLKAFELIGDRLGDCRLIMVGDGPMRDDLEEYINGHGLQQRVIITGPRNDVPDFLNLFDLFVLSSLSEGTSISLLEAMASGLPAVVTNVGGNPAIVEHNTDGLVVEPSDPAALAEAIVKILSNPELHRTFSERCTAKVRRDYSIERMAESYCRLYLEILHGKKRFVDVQL